MPIKLKGKTIACININSFQKDAFDNDDLKLLDIVAQQIGVAINNATQAEALKKSEETLKENLDRLSKKSRYEEIISTITRSVHSSIDLNEVLENAVEAMTENIEIVEQVSIYFVEGKEAVIQIQRGFPDGFIEKVRRIPHPKGFTWNTILEGKTRYCPDVDEDTVIGPAGRKAGTKSYVSIPLKIEGNTIGCINVHSFQKNAFEEDDINLLEVVAKQIGIAINKSKNAEALTHSEERYRILYNENPSMYFTISEEGNVLSVNQHGVEQLGYTVEELVGNSVLAVFHKEDQASVKEQLNNCFENPGQVFKWELRKVCKDQHVIWVDEMARCVWDADGNKVALIVCEDITERKQADSLLLSEKRILEMIPQGKPLPEILEHICLAVEKQTNRMLCSFCTVDNTGKALVSCAAPSLPEKYGNDVDGLAIGPGIACCGTAAYTKKQVIVSDTSTDPLWADFRDMALEHSLRACWSTPILSNKGDVLGTFAMYYFEPRKPKQREMDLIERATHLARIAIERKKTEETLLESEERYRTLVENAYDLIIEISIDSRFVYLSPNHKDVLGYDPSELIGRKIYENIHPEDRPAVRANFEKSAGIICGALGISFNELMGGNIHEIVHPDDLPALRTKLEDAIRVQLKVEESSLLYRYRHSNGEWRWLESTGQPFWTSTGEIRVVISSRDITERRKAEQELKNAFSEIEKLKNELERENIYLQEEVKLHHSHGEIVGESKAMQSVLSLAEQVANTESTVLLLGETGTGKELLANAIHKMSPRRERAIVTVNCAALQLNLIESELFGHERGAFTGAVTKRVGRFEIADGSTIFLDEVGDLSLELQSKLLRVLQEGCFERLGSEKTIEVDVRVLVATNRDLTKAVEEGTFREDLFYRLNVFPINIPPLREREEDIPLLVNGFVKEFGERMGKNIENIPKKTMEALMSYKWPGNIRELRNVIERAIILAKGSSLRIELPSDILRSESRVDMAMVNIEKEHILRVLEMTHWRIRGKGCAAEILGLKPTTLASKIHKLGIVHQSKH